jgi:hypothetical protein
MRKRKKLETEAMADLMAERAQRRTMAEEYTADLGRNHVPDLEKIEQKAKVITPSIFNNLEKSARDGGGDPRGREAAQESTSETSGREAAQESTEICPHCDHPAADRAAAKGELRCTVVGGRIVVCPWCRGSGKVKA